ncbi:hypothetical protein HY212_00710 [Candidatus Pacearchaeota archaeon]|nr:hypothetical protein [Candidatus Pacearchaeota archaeon]
MGIIDVVGSEFGNRNMSLTHDMPITLDMESDPIHGRRLTWLDKNTRIIMLESAE